MSAKIEARSSRLVGRTIILAALAGLAGVAITFAVAASLLLGGGGASAPASVSQPALEPGYVDYGVRQRWMSQPTLAPGYVDYGVRHRTQP